MQSVEFEYDLGQNVKISLIGKRGEVRSQMRDIDGALWYSVRYVDADGDICSDWMRQRDLSPVSRRGRARRPGQGKKSRK